MKSIVVSKKKFRFVQDGWSCSDNPCFDRLEEINFQEETVARPTRPFLDAYLWAVRVICIKLAEFVLKCALRNVSRLKSSCKVWRERNINSTLHFSIVISLRMGLQSRIRDQPSFCWVSASEAPIRRGCKCQAGFVRQSDESGSPCITEQQCVDRKIAFIA